MIFTKKQITIYKWIQRLGFCTLFLFIATFSNNLFAQTMVTLEDQCNCEVLKGTEVTTAGTTSPAGAETGDLYVNTDTGALFFWDGDSWEVANISASEWADGNFNGEDVVYAKQAFAAGDTIALKDNGQFRIGSMDDFGDYLVDPVDFAKVAVTHLVDQEDDDVTLNSEKFAGFFVNKVKGTTEQRNDILNGLRGEVNIQPDVSSNFGELRGNFGEVSHQGSGQINNTVASMGATIMRGNGTINNAFGGRFFTSMDAVGSGTITTANGVWAQVINQPDGGGTITNANLINASTGGTGRVQNLRGAFIQGINKGDVTNTGVRINTINTPSTTGNYGLDIGNILGSTGDNYAIRTGQGLVLFNDNLIINKANENPRIFLGSNNSTTYSNRVIDVNNGIWRLYREGGPEGTQNFLTVNPAGDLGINLVATEKLDVDGTARLRGLQDDGNPTNKIVVADANGVLKTASAKAIGSISALRTETADYTMVAEDGTVLVDATAGHVTVTLPTPVLGQKIVIKKIDTTGNQVVMNGAGANIDGQATRTTTVPYQAFTLQGDGNNWYIIAK